MIAATAWAPCIGPEREAVHRPEGQQALDGQVAVREPGPPLGRALVPPRRQGRSIDPEGERAPADQGVVVVLPVADAVDGFGRGLRSGSHGWGWLFGRCVRFRSSLPDTRTI